MKASLYALSCVLLACGGRGKVNLGDNTASAGWSNARTSTNASTTQPDVVAAQEAQTLYDNVTSVLAIAVDDSTIAALIVHTESNWEPPLAISLPPSGHARTDCA